MLHHLGLRCRQRIVELGLAQLVVCDSYYTRSDPRALIDLGLYISLSLLIYVRRFVFSDDWRITAM